MQVKQIQNNKKLALITLSLLIILLVSMFSINVTLAVKPGTVPVLLDPKTIPKYQNQLVVPPVYTPDAVGGTTYTVSMEETYRQQILPTAAQGMVFPVPGDGKTKVWGYQGDAIIRGNTLLQFDPTYGTAAFDPLTSAFRDGQPLTTFVFSPSATFEAIKGTATTVNWINNINGWQPFAVDPTLNWANPGNVFPPGDIFANPARTHPTFSFALNQYGYDGTNTHPAGSNLGNLNAQTPVALVPHLHGAEVSSFYDGGPEAWWTSAATKFRGPNFHTAGTLTDGEAQYIYPNSQEPNTLWYHDHALGITRINVMSGLAGFYLLRDTPTNIATGTPITSANLDEYLTQTFPYGISEIPLAIQDRTFQANGELWFPEVGLNPTIHPYWMPEFFGNTIMVNGKVWPNLDVTPGWYRFRLLDGSNARFYTLSFDNKMPFTVIGADGGYLQQPATVNTLTIAPGERADILVDFTNIPVGTKIILTNTAKAPFPNGAKADPQTTGQIMQFTVTATQSATGAKAPLPASTWALPLPPTMLLNPNLTPPATGAPFPTLSQSNPVKTRYITLNEVMGPAGPLMVMINGQYYDTTTSTEVPPGSGNWVTGVGATEKPKAGDTEEWVIINLTADTHPIHLHLVTFQLVNRQPFQATKYNTAWLKQQVGLDPNTGTNAQLMPPFPKYYPPKILQPNAYYQGKPILPTPTEMTWKDTLQMNPGEVTTIRVKFASQDGTPFPANWFDGTSGDGIYVYHCHIIDHEDNEMMRPYIVIK